MLKFVRWATIAMVVGLLALMLGPFRQIEQDSGISDKLAHALALGIVTLALLVNFRALSRLSLSGIAFGLAVFVEVAQAGLGRDAELADLLAGGVGIACVMLVWFPRRLI